MSFVMPCSLARSFRVADVIRVMLERCLWMQVELAAPVKPEDVLGVGETSDVSGWTLAGAVLTWDTLDDVSTVDEIKAMAESRVDAVEAVPPDRCCDEPPGDGGALLIRVIARQQRVLFAKLCVHCLLCRVGETIGVGELGVFCGQRGLGLKMLPGNARPRAEQGGDAA